MPPEQIPAGQAAPAAPEPVATQTAEPTEDLLRGAIEIDDDEVEAILGVKGATGAEPTNPAGGAAAAAPGQNDLFIDVYGQKVPVKDGKPDEAALAKALGERFVPQDQYHRDLSRARTTQAQPPQQQAPPTPKAAPKFDRKKFEGDPEDDPLGFERHERAEDKRENDWRWEQMERREARREERRIKEAIESRFTREYEDALGKVGVEKSDAPAVADFRRLMWHVAAADARLYLNEPSADEAPQEGDEDYVGPHPRMSTQDVLADNYKTIQAYIDYKVDAAVKKIRATGGNSAPSPHAGGAPASPATAAPAASEEGPSPRKEGETAFDAIKRDAVRAAARRQRQGAA